MTFAFPRTFDVTGEKSSDYFQKRWKHNLSTLSGITSTNSLDQQIQRVYRKTDNYVYETIKTIRNFSRLLVVEWMSKEVGQLDRHRKIWNKLSIPNFFKIRAYSYFFVNNRTNFSTPRLSKFSELFIHNEIKNKFL